MARDYKNAGNRSKAKPEPNEKPAPIAKKRGAVASNKSNVATTDKPGFSPLLSMGLGLAIGLSVAVYIYFVSQPAPVEGVEPEVAVVIKNIDPSPVSSSGETADEEGGRFDFYSILPKLEVVIPDQELHQQRRGLGGEGEQKTIKSPGHYLLQVGSFRKASDAERVKAELAFLGVESYIEPVVIDSSKTWHRVRVGPFSDNKSLDKIRNRLLDNRVEVMVLRVKEG